MDLYSMLVGAVVAIAALGSYYEWRTHRLMSQLKHAKHDVATEFVRIIADEQLAQALETLESPLIQPYQPRRTLKVCKP